MQITAARSWTEALTLTRPYTIAYKTIDAIELMMVEIETDGGLRGLGSASPSPLVTGETVAACQAALAPEALEWLVGADPRHLGAHLRRIETSMRYAPAARAAVDMALHDLLGQILGVPVVDLLGRCHDALPTSVTLGIASVEESLADAEDFLAKGFRCLKVKIGNDFDEDGERLSRLRELAGPEIPIRVDGNQGYSGAETRRLALLVDRLDLELVEQPLPVGDDTRALPRALRRVVAADESLCDTDDALLLAREPRACGIFNIKLMKCGGIAPARDIAAIARAAEIDLMWGCNDESVVSIAAALHVAYACPHTRYIDLDGSLDLPRDPARGGFTIDGKGCLRVLERPGLGVEREEPS